MSRFPAYSYTGFFSGCHSFALEAVSIPKTNTVHSISGSLGLVKHPEKQEILHVAMRKTIPTAVSILAATIALTPQLCRADAQIQSSRFTSNTDLGTTTFHWDILLKPGPGGNYNVQLFLQDLNHPGQYITVNPGPAVVLNLFPDSDNTGTFTANLPVGHYGNGKAVLFAAGSNYAAAMPDIPLSGMDTTITTTQIRVTKPEIIAYPSSVKTETDGKEHIPFYIKEPAGTTTIPGGGFWAMAKGTGGFMQLWVPEKDFRPSGDTNDNYMVYTGEFSVAPPSGPGLYNVNIGLFDSAWAKLDWLYPGIDYETGNWVVKAEPSRYPSIADALSRKNGLLAIGGNYGNAIATMHTSDNSSANYFKLLRSLGMTFIRTNYDPDAYLSDSIYREKVDQIVQNQLEARLVPIIAPQTMPAASGGHDPVSQLIAVNTLVAKTYKGLPVVIDILNEPHNYASWGLWKKDAVEVLQSVKAANPSAVTIVGFEGYSEDGRAAAKDPISPSLVTYYAMHSYHTPPAEVPSRIGNLINVILEEWHNTNPDMARAIASTPFVGEAAWAWTTPGQDAIPLVKEVDGAALELTDDGNIINNWQQAWAKGSGN